MADKQKTVVDDMPNRTIVNTPDEAIATLNRFAETYVDFGSYNMVAPGVAQDDDGTMIFDPAVYTPEMRVMIAIVSVRNGIGNSTVKGILICPAPTIASILADETAKAWLDKQIDIALNASAARALRKKDAKATDPEVLEAMPKTLADYVTNTGGSSTLLEAYEELWRDIKAVLGELSKAFRLANLSKREFRRGMESKPYAERFYSPIENTKSGSVFEFALQAFMTEGKERGYDVAIFQKWLDNRAVTEIEEGEGEGDGELSLDVLSAGLSKRAADAAAEAAKLAAAQPAPAPATT